MKKVLAIGVFAMFGVIALSSCKKEYNCVCTDPSGTYTETSKGKDAQDACDDATSVLLLKVCVPE